MTTTLLQQWSTAVTGVTERVRRALVQIVNDDGSIGAGTIWHPDGLIVTNAHVVFERGRVRAGLRVVLPDGEVRTAQRIADDLHADLAALAVDGGDLPTVEIGDSRNLRPGQWVMALGHPWGMTDALTAGTVIGMGNHLPEMADHREWVALNLKLRPGHSGGPLFDAGGRLVGINTMISGPEVGFAIPVHLVKQFLKAAIGLHTGTPEAEPEPGAVEVI